MNALTYGQVRQLKKLQSVHQFLVVDVFCVISRIHRNDNCAKHVHLEMLHLQHPVLISDFEGGEKHTCARGVRLLKLQGSCSGLLGGVTGCCTV